MKNKIFNIVTIICFCSVILIPAGIVLMLFYTDWNRKLKIFLTSILSVLYVVLFVFFMLMEPSSNAKGFWIPFGSYERTVDSENPLSAEKFHKENPESGLRKKGKTGKTGIALKSTKSTNASVKGRGIYALFFLILMLILIIIRNLKDRKDDEKENPYVDVKQYRFPLKKMDGWPTVHFQKIPRRENEKFLYACQSKHNMTEGDILVTNQRFVFKGPNENLTFELSELEAAASVSDTCFVLTCNEKKFYFFVQEGQLKYALNVLRFACGMDV